MEPQPCSSYSIKTFFHPDLRARTSIQDHIPMSRMEMMATGPRVLRSRTSVTAGERGQVCPQRTSLTTTVGCLRSARFVPHSSQKGLQGPRGIEFGTDFLLQISIWDRGQSLCLTECKNSYSGALIRNLYRRADRR